MSFYTFERDEGYYEYIEMNEDTYLNGVDCIGELFMLK